MKKFIFTLLLTVIIIPQLFAETGTVQLIYTNGTVSYNDTQTFYEFDVSTYIDGGDGQSIFREGMVYVQYNTTIFGSSIVTNGKLVSVTFLGPLAVKNGSNDPLYSLSNNGTDTFTNTFSLTFEADFAFGSGHYGSDTYITNSSGSPVTFMRIKMEVAASGTSTVSWSSSIGNDVNIYREHSDGTLFEALSTTGATETTEIVYSNTGDPALPITLKNFAAQYDDAKVVLNWTTDSETQNMGFFIKRAVKYAADDLSDYDIIASYMTDETLYGAGTTTEQHNYVYYDSDVKPGISYSYILEDVDYNGYITSHGPLSIAIPENILFANEDFSLGSNYPNPFNPSFTIPFELTRAMNVSINMYDITGRQVLHIADGFMEPKRYRLYVDGSHLNSGIYFVRTIVGQEVFTQKMIMLK